MIFSEGTEWIIAEDLSSTILEHKEDIDFVQTLDLMKFLKRNCSKPDQAFEYMTQSYQHFEKVMYKVTRLIKVKLAQTNSEQDFNFSSEEAAQYATFKRLSKGF